MNEVSGMGTTAVTAMDIEEVLRHLPHRYPFVLVDRVLELRAGETLRAIKNVSFGEPYFQGHFPHYPVMPGVLILEAMAQACAILGFKTVGTTAESDNVYLFVGIDKARFRQQVRPGDQLLIEVRFARTLRSVWCFQGLASVDGVEVASAELMCTLKGLT
jgi:3-hydroxyacyl-[acyl-carrier-protein] dehydratase